MSIVYHPESITKKEGALIIRLSANYASYVELHKQLQTIIMVTTSARDLIEPCMTYIRPCPNPNWPTHLNALAFAYDATPHTTTGYQP